VELPRSPRDPEIAWGARPVGLVRGATPSLQRHPAQSSPALKGTTNSALFVNSLVSSSQPTCAGSSVVGSISIACSRVPRVCVHSPEVMFRRSRARAQILTSMDFSFSKGGKDFTVLHRHPSLPPLMTSTASSYGAPTKATRAIQIRRSQTKSVIILPPSRTESREQRRHAAPESPYASHLPPSEPLTVP
jgi:hypothetical protein